jgi:hypothetical protein
LANRDSSGADKVTFKISTAAAPYVGADKPREVRLKAAAGLVALEPTDFVLLVYYLCHDADPEVKHTAISTLRGLDIAFLSKLLSNPELHPRILDALVQLHGRKPELTALFTAHPMLSEKAALLLAQNPASAPSAGPDQAAPQKPAQSAAAAAKEGSSDAAKDAEDRSQEAVVAAAVERAAEETDEGTDEETDEETVDEESEEFKSKYQMAQAMGVGDKIKAALTGDKEWRGILIKDSNKLVSGAVVKNPRITEGEVLTIAKSAVQNDEIMRVICANKEWIKNSLIRKALVMNNKTPLPHALRFIGTLGEKDLAMLAKSKNVSSVIVSQARRALLAKKKK